MSDKQFADSETVDLQSQAEASQTLGEGDGTVESGTIKRSPFKRVLLLVTGLALVVLAAVGVFLPGLPATGPLILASICLTKSSPALERRLVRSRFFAPFQQYLDGNAVMPVKAKVIAISMMWICILVSSYFTLRSGAVPTWLVLSIASSGLLGTWFIWRFRRQVDGSKIEDDR